MRSVDFQTVHTQTPAVERSYQTRPGQSEQEQRTANVIQRQDVDQKMMETQATHETEGSIIDPEKEKAKERQKGKKKHKKGEVQPEVKQEAKAASKRIDIRV